MPAAKPETAVRPAEGGASERFAALLAFRARVRRLPGGRLAWRAGVAVVGLLIIAGGVVLLPLPGPGWVVIFLGVGVWGTEFQWANRLLRWVRTQVVRWTSWLARRPRWQQLGVGAAVLVVVAGCVIGAWYVTWLV